MTKKSAKSKNKTKQNSQKTNQPAELTWLPKKTFELEFRIPWPQIKQTYDKLFEKMAKQVKVKGFRKGKAPKRLVEKELDKQQLYQQVLKEILPQTYQKAVETHNLNPVVSPKIEPVSLEEGKPWQFKATACERPEVKLGNYQKAVKGELAKTEIWTPEKGPKPDKKEKSEKEPGKSYDQKLRAVTSALLEKAEVELPDILVENELNRRLSRLLDQINALGMTLEQYLSSKGTTNEQLKQREREQVEQTLKLEFILQEIIKDRQIEIKPEEINKMIEATKDKEARKKLDTPSQRAYIASILAKRKVLDYLTSL